MPQVSKAERHRNLTCPRIRDPSKGSYTLFSIWKFTDREFLQYGLGVMLWFKLVRRLAWLFFFLFLLNLPYLVFNAHGPDGGIGATRGVAGTGVSSSSNSGGALLNDDNSTSPGNSSFASGSGALSSDGSFGLSLTTLANQGLSLNATIMGYDKEQIGLLTGALDTFSCVVFLAAMFWLVRDHRRHAASYNSSVMTVRRFTVLVTDLPQLTPALTRLQVADWFSAHFGETVDVSLAYDDTELVQLFRQRGEIRRDMLNAQAQGKEDLLAKLRSKLKQFDSQLAFKRRQFTRHVRAAFVTFQNQDSVTRALDAFPNSWWRRCLLKKHLLFQGAKIRVTRAAEPSNTLFHNLGLSRRSQACRRLWTGVVSLALMSVSFVAVFVSQYYQQSLPSTVTCAQAGIISQDQVHDRESLFCFCGGLDAGKLLTEYSNYCSDFVLKFSIAKGLIFLTAASTVIVNALLQMFMDRLAKLERHGSVTSQQRGITSRLFWGLWFNTGVIILLVNADVKPYVGRALLPGDYSDFDVDWFNEVGVSVLVTYVHRSMRARMSLFCIVCSVRC